MSVVRLMIVLLLFSCAPAPSQASYDGKTWRAWPQQERGEFVNGYLAYLITQGQIFEGRVTHYERELSAYVDSVPEVASKDVGDLLQLVAPRVRRVPTRGERDPDDKYGLFTGRYWFPLQDKDHRIRFLQGYLHAQRRNPKDTERYSKTVEEYERLVDAEFRKPDSDLERGIGEVLSLFRDR